MLKKITNENNQKFIVCSLIAGVLFLSGMYIFFVHKTVFYVVKRGEVTDKISSLSASITTLQSKQISLSNKITSEMAKALGYKEVKPTFIPRQPISAIARSNSLQ